MTFVWVTTSFSVMLGRPRRSRRTGMPNQEQTDRNRQNRHLQGMIVVAALVAIVVRIARRRSRRPSMTVV
eukprot:scaffold4840_cov275-Pinguiococcus_pyrenoidosus.AAC.3